ncbi:unnamed protein product [Rotaria sp. Silwood2]|nr:unnamed protein product [Rotaria sp. Silwood2]CAF2862589.1 unnamed protein product [Rotaria sp. Silwood2]CAF3256870.1 unnamed protein product [Rotaria sp. Silwood2]CAF4073203.1 unnamed protein product [Rotaria sp. Silwood2]CAF4097949.1 unnamed protein product [Rotaria sp. Silwood2]
MDINLFQVESQSFIESFISSITNTFIRSIRLVQDTTQGNALRSMASEVNTKALDRSLPSRFALDSTIGSIVDRLMVEEWTNITSHKAYYDRCQPITCTYSYVDKKIWLVVITTVIGLIRGLTIVLKFVVLLVVKSFFYCCYNRVQPLSNNGKT